MEMHCVNQTTIFIASNAIFHERTKYIEVDCHFIRYLLMQNEIITLYMKSRDQLGDILTKTIGSIYLQ